MSRSREFSSTLLPALSADIEALEAKMKRRFGRFRHRLEALGGEDSEGSLMGYRVIVERAIASFEDEISSLKRWVALLETAQG